MVFDSELLFIFEKKKSKMAPIAIGKNQLNPLLLFIFCDKNFDGRILAAKLN